MKVSDRTYIIILIIAILSLSLITHRHFGTFMGGLPKVEIPELERPELDFDVEEFLPTEKKGYKEWVSPDKKLKLAYPDNWIIMEKAFLEHGAMQGITLKEEEILLFVYRLKIAGHSFPYLTVSRVEAEKTLEKITAEIQQNIEASGGEKEITLLETENDITDLELVFKYPGQINFYVKGRIFFTEEKNYLVLFTTSQQAWPELKEETEKIFDSIELLQ